MRRAVTVMLATLILASGARGEERVKTDAKGRTVAVPVATPEALRNPWPEAEEEAFLDRCDRLIERLGAAGGYGNTYFENEKRSYPAAMMGFLAGHREAALKFLQGRDANAGDWNKHTLGIDLFPCFTLKQQLRKYFFFGPYLDPEYRARMKQAADIWTEKDPLRRPHPAHKPGASGWTPVAKNSWVDVRGTDNLQAMRDVAVYLFAEEAGNTATRDLYRKKIANTIRNMFTVGMGEWDSENYHGHTMTAYLQLYDFAKDPEVRLMGKAAMDSLSAIGAFKFYRGAFGGPTKRDYNHPYAWGGSAADHLGLYFDDAPLENPDPAADNVHFITSAYRPPMAAVGLARKEFARPTEVLVSHPPYGALRGPGGDEPLYYETTFFGHTYQLGTLARGTCDADTNGFKLVAYSAERGADYFIANTTADPLYIGSPKYHDKTHVGGSGVGQYRHLAVWLNPKGGAPFLFLAPKTATVSSEQGITFLACEKTWIALFPVNLEMKGVDRELTDRANFDVKTDKKTREKTRVPRWPDVQILSARGKGGPACGFAIEIGEAETHGDLAAFKAAVLAKSKLDVSNLAKGEAELAGSNGGRVKVALTGEKYPKVWRDGTLHPWTEHPGLYVPADGGDAPIRLERMSGHLHVEAGGHTFDGRVAEDGGYTFTNTGGRR